MGLGKTLQTLALLSYMKQERGLAGPSLVVCPLSVLSSWMAELARWAPHLRAVRMHTSNAAQKLALRKEVGYAAIASGSASDDPCIGRSRYKPQCII